MAFDLKVYFADVGKTPARVTSADVMGFITRQRNGPGDSNVIPIERPLLETDTESAELLDVVARWRAIGGGDHFVVDFGNPSSTEPILRFSEQVMSPLRQ